MNRKLLCLFSSLLLAGSLVACANNGGKKGSSTPAPQSSEGSSEEESSEEEVNLEPGDYNILVWVDTKIKALTESQLAAFKNTLPEGVNVTFTVDPVGEGSAAGNMITDPESGADVYGFAQDQLARLITANCLTTIGGSMRKTVEARNDAGSVAAATSARKLYAFPMTADNGYFLYYNKSVINADQAKNLTTLLAACKTAGKTFAYKAGDAWYNAGFFFGAGCESTWTANSAGKFVSYVDTYNSDKGLVAAKAIRELVTDSAFVDASDAGSAFSGDSAAVVSGTWDSAVVKEKLGENFAAAELPSYTVGGKDYHMGSFSGYKLVGVKPQVNATKAAICQMAASYITDKAAQLARFEALGWGPSNKEAQAEPAVAADEALTAFNAQAAYATPQGQYPGGWWTLANAIPGDIQALGATSTDTQLRAILADYAAALDDFLDGK